MEYADTRSSSRAHLKSRGKKRNETRTWVCRCSNRGRRAVGGKGMKVGRANAGGALRRALGIAEGLDKDVSLDDGKIETSQYIAEQVSIEDAMETEKFLEELPCPLGVLLHGLDEGEKLEGSSVCNSVEEWLSEVGEGFEMLDLSSSISSAGSVSDDSWAVVPGVD